MSLELSIASRSDMQMHDHVEHMSVASRYERYSLNGHLQRTYPSLTHIVICPRRIAKARYRTELCSRK
jgi:hypothetical protein